MDINSQKNQIMKNTMLPVIFFSIYCMAAPFTVMGQDKAKVTVTIKNLTAISTDACNQKMDFYGNITIDGKTKSFPLMEGNNIRPNWQFVTTTDKEIVTPLIQILDDDDALCGGGDDEVSISGSASRIRKSLVTTESQTKDFTSQGTSSNNGNEMARISFTINIEPTKTGFLTKGNWKNVRKEYKTGSGPWEELHITTIPPTCETADNFHIFRTNGLYEINDGPVKCNPTDPQIITTYSWSFQANETQIRLTKRGSSLFENYTINQLDENIMILSSSYSSGGVTTYHRTVFKH